MLFCQVRHSSYLKRTFNHLSCIRKIVRRKNTLNFLCNSSNDVLLMEKFILEKYLYNIALSLYLETKLNEVNLLHFSD